MSEFIERDSGIGTEHGATQSRRSMETIDDDNTVDSEPREEAVN